MTTNEIPNVAGVEKSGIIKPQHVIIAALCVLVLWAANWLFVYLAFQKSDVQGQFGDQFGAVNALFSGLAFAGIIYSLFLQRKATEDQGRSIDKQSEQLIMQKEELTLQRKAMGLQLEEMQMQRDEMKMQRDEMEKSRQEFEQQNFNNVFFSLLKQQRELIEGAFASVESNYWDTNHFNGAKELHGPALFEYFKTQQKFLIQTFSKLQGPNTFNPDFDLKKFNTEQLKAHDEEEFNSNRETQKGVFDYYSFDKRDFHKIKDANPIQHSRLAYAYLFVKFHNSLSAYFRHMYHILVFIKQQKDEEIKSQKETIDDQKTTIIKKYNAYAGYLQAQMSPAELFLTFYNGLNFPKLQALLIEFNLLENLDEEELHGIKSGDIEGMVFRSRRNLIEVALLDK